MEIILILTGEIHSIMALDIQPSVTDIRITALMVTDILMEDMVTIMVTVWAMAWVTVWDMVWVMEWAMDLDMVDSTVVDMVFSAIATMDMLSRMAIAVSATADRKEPAICHQGGIAM
jgi:hypothetical protein